MTTTDILSECLSLAEKATVNLLNDEQYRIIANKLQEYYENFKKLEDKCSDLEKRTTLLAGVAGTVSECTTSGQLGYKKACVFFADFWKTNEFWMNLSSIDVTLLNSVLFLGEHVPRLPDMVLSEDANFMEKIYIKKNETIQYGIWKNGSHEITLKKNGKQEDQQKIICKSINSNIIYEIEYSLFPNFHARIYCNNMFMITEHPELFIYKMNPSAKFIYNIYESEINLDIVHNTERIKTRIDLTSSLNPKISFYKDSIIRYWKIEQGSFIVHKLGEKIDCFVLTYNESTQTWKSNKIPEYFARNEPYRPSIKIKFNIQKKSRRISKRYLR